MQFRVEHNFRQGDWPWAVVLGTKNTFSNRFSVNCYHQNWAVKFCGSKFPEKENPVVKNHKAIWFIVRDSGAVRRHASRPDNSSHCGALLRPGGGTKCGELWSSYCFCWKSNSPSQIFIFAIRWGWEIMTSTRPLTEPKQLTSPLEGCSFHHGCIETDQPPQKITINHFNPTSA